jgi:hypothetical protein
MGEFWSIPRVFILRSGTKQLPRVDLPHGTDIDARGPAQKKHGQTQQNGTEKQTAVEMRWESWTFLDQESDLPQKVKAFASLASKRPLTSNPIPLPHHAKSLFSYCSSEKMKGSSPASYLASAGTLTGYPPKGSLYVSCVWLKGFPFPRVLDNRLEVQVGLGFV